MNMLEEIQEKTFIQTTLPPTETCFLLFFSTVSRVMIITVYNNCDYDGLAFYIFFPLF